jgi:hypothetical protein
MLDVLNISGTHACGRLSPAGSRGFHGKADIAASDEHQHDKSRGGRGVEGIQRVMSHTEEEELPPSKLGTKEHWDGVYE